MSTKKTLVLGATENPSRYANMAINRLRQHGHPVEAIGRKTGQVLDVEIQDHLIDYKDIDTVTLYLNPQNQQEYYEYILKMKPNRVIFNPGTENVAFEDRLRREGIEPIEACTLVMLSTGLF